MEYLLLQRVSVNKKRFQFCSLISNATFVRAMQRLRRGVLVWIWTTFVFFKGETVHFFLSRPINVCVLRRAHLETIAIRTC